MLETTNENQLTVWSYTDLQTYGGFCCCCLIGRNKNGPTENPYRLKQCDTIFRPQENGNALNIFLVNSRSKRIDIIHH